MVKGGGLKIRWRRPAWVQIPPPAPFADDASGFYSCFHVTVQCDSCYSGLISLSVVPVIVGWRG